MKAVVLVGGEGTRLRPLTETIPKPLIPLVDRPFLDHVLDHLATHGVEDALLSSPYLEEVFASFLRDRHGGPRLTWITEPTPLGTAGAVANAAREIREAFLVLNGDILTDLDLSRVLAHHREAGAIATIALAPVEDARPYGLVRVSEDGRVLEFREKPQQAIPGLVNAGTYVLEPGAVRDVPPGRAVSIEREVFPALIDSDAPVHGYVSRDYWKDLGTPESYLRATFDALEGRVKGLSYAAPFADPTAHVSLRCHLGRWVVIGPAARIEDDAEVEDSVLLAGAVVEEAARVRDSIVGPGARIGRRAVLSGAVLAEGAVIPPGSSADGARVGAGEVYVR
ncbi:MAG TPA: NDP-sugar synthase [Actinomycetota bacterium]